MTASRRKLVIRYFEGLALAVVFLDLLIYFGVVRTYADWATADEKSCGALRLQVREKQARVARLEKYQAALPAAQKDIELFVHDHVPGRQMAFSRVTNLIRQVAAQSGIQLLSISYKIKPTRGEPFDNLEVGVSVEGSYSGLLSFAHSLETASDLIVINNFVLAQQQDGSVGMKMSLELYLTP